MVIKNFNAFLKINFNRLTFLGESHEGPICNFNDKTDENKLNPCLAIFIYGDHSLRISSLPKEQKKQQVLAHLSRLFPKQKVDCTAFYDQSWSNSIVNDDILLQLYIFTIHSTAREGTLFLQRLG